MSAQARKTALRQENKLIIEKMQLFKNQSNNSQNLQREMSRFVTESKKNLEEMQESISEESTRQNKELHAKTSEYQGTLKNQIGLLTRNKELTEGKDRMDKKFNESVEKLAADYEKQIGTFESKVKGNVKKIQDMSGGNIIKRLLKNERFRAAMAERGCSLDCLEQQSKLEDVANEVEEKEQEILEKEEKSQKLDEELSKMHELIDTMKELLENMVKEKDNITKQNSILKLKLQQSQELIAKLLGAGGIPLEGDDEENDDDDCEGEEEEEQK